MSGTSSVEQSFDVAALNCQLGEAKRKKRAFLLGCLVFVMAIALLFLYFFVPPLIHGDISPIQLSGLGVILVFATFSLLAIASGIKFTGSGGALIRVDNDALRVVLPSGRELVSTWSRPSASLELYDFSAVPRSRVTVATSYAIRLDGVETVLPKDAFDAILSFAREHRLTVRVTRGSVWVYPRAVAPAIYRFTSS
jgi:hypothetical protein